MPDGKLPEVKLPNPKDLVGIVRPTGSFKDSAISAIGSALDAAGDAREKKLAEEAAKAAAPAKKSSGSNPLVTTGNSFLLLGLPAGALLFVLPYVWLQLYGN